MIESNSARGATWQDMSSWEHRESKTKVSEMEDTGSIIHAVSSWMKRSILSLVKLEVELKLPGATLESSMLFTAHSVYRRRQWRLQSSWSSHRSLHTSGVHKCIVWAHKTLTVSHTIIQPSAKLRGRAGRSILSSLTPHSWSCKG